jgi:hypothetical protein
VIPTRDLSLFKDFGLTAKGKLQIPDGSVECVQPAAVRRPEHAGDVGSVWRDYDAGERAAAGAEWGLKLVFGVMSGAPGPV